MPNVYVLMLAQALAGCGTIMLVTFGGIAGTRIAPLPALATLPLSISILGTALISLPAALLMQRIGRRNGFIASALLGILAALLTGYAIANGAFMLLCVAGFLLGGNMAFVQQYRFAATEYVAPGDASKAIATVILGTLIAAMLGPALGQMTRNLGGWQEFTGSFLSLAGLFLLAAGVLTRLEPAPVRVAETSAAGRPLGEIMRQPTFRLAALSGVVAYAVMSFIMTATPISMHEFDHQSSGATSLVITAHLLGMYLPSLATPWLAARLRIKGMMLTGLAAIAGCVFISVVLGHQFTHYFWGLALLGVGWNLLFVAATSLLTTSYQPAERFRAQGCNDLLVFGSQACASLAAGAAITGLGWVWVNLLTLPFLALTAWAVFAYQRTPHAA